MQPNTVDLIVYVVAGIPVAGAMVYTAYHIANGLLNHRSKPSDGDTE